MEGAPRVYTEEEVLVKCHRMMDQWKGPYESIIEKSNLKVANLQRSIHEIQDTIEAHLEEAKAAWRKEWEEEAAAKQQEGAPRTRTRAGAAAADQEDWKRKYAGLHREFGTVMEEQAALIANHTSLESMYGKMQNDNARLDQLVQNHRAEYVRNADALKAMQEALHTAKQDLEMVKGERDRLATELDEAITDTSSRDERYNRLWRLYEAKIMEMFHMKNDLARVLNLKLLDIPRVPWNDESRETMFKKLEQYTLIGATTKAKRYRIWRQVSKRIPKVALGRDGMLPVHCSISAPNCEYEFCRLMSATTRPDFADTRIGRIAIRFKEGHKEFAAACMSSDSWVGGVFSARTDPVADEEGDEEGDEDGDAEESGSSESDGSDVDSEDDEEGSDEGEEDDSA